MTVTLNALCAYLTACRRELAAARLFVLGHPAPDGDAAVSSLMEGWRRTLSGTPAVPVLQAQAVPREVAWLLGEAAALLLTAPEAAPLLDNPDSRFVLTDHHESPYLPRTVAVVDHHPLSADLTGRELTLRPVGAATTLVAARMREDGLLPDTGVARILLGGILLDTDGLSPYKSKPEDTAAAAWLAALCGEDTASFYAALQAQLLAEEDVAVLYRRDYRAYPLPDGTPGIGFAILKVWRDAPPDREAVRRLLAEDAVAGGYAACVAKVMLFAPDGGREELYLAAGKAAGPVLDGVEEAAQGGARRIAPDVLFLPTDCPHPGRKRLALQLLQRISGENPLKKGENPPKKGW